MCFIRGELYSCLRDSLIQLLLTLYKYDISSVDYLVLHSQTCDTHTQNLTTPSCVQYGQILQYIPDPIHMNITLLLLISSEFFPHTPQGSVCLKV